jgi:hypothetical protein
MARRHAVRWVALALWMVGGGCGNPFGPAFSSSMEEATVKGIVRVRGKPVTNGQITFRPANVNRRNAPTQNAPIGKDGSYTVKTLVGENSVIVVSSAALLCTLMHPASADDTPKKGDLAKIQGVWKGKTGRNGMFESVMTIKGDTGRLDNTTANGRKIGLTYKITIDEGAKPHKTLDSSDIVRYGGSGKGADHVFGIYEFVDDNTIRFCNGFDKYPTEFKDGDDGPPILFTLKRVTEDAKPEKTE